MKPMVMLTVDAAGPKHDMIRMIAAGGFSFTASLVWNALFHQKKNSLLRKLE